MSETKVQVEVLVVGGGQAGLAMSEHLSSHNIDHLVLERDRIAERWRSQRWDSLVANGPAWHDRMPSLEFKDVNPDGFATKDQVADYFSAYAEKIAAPIRCGVEVTSVQRLRGRAGFRVETTDGILEARFVVAATGPFQRPVIPPVIPESAGLHQIHSSQYRNPGELPAGAVLVVGSGSSGVQIADELHRSGRQVYLSVGPHERPPRSYRGRDLAWWLGVLGKWEADTPDRGAEHVTIAISGARGGHTVDLRTLAHDGVVLLGRTESFDRGVARFAPGIADNIALGDAGYFSLLDQADAYIEQNGLDFPEEPDAWLRVPTPQCVSHPLLDLDLNEAGISTVVWATGFAVDYSWLKVDTFEENGRPRHKRGVAAERGVYFLGLPWLSHRGSSFIWGVWNDAKYVADRIATQKGYLAYRVTEDSQASASGYPELPMATAT
ncbi:putative flavoprotein involved in K+ transport [Psychromicrobium silvestre]|uniref:Putative flavoprotein involved in K+ transport n=1 Tax=Psychromicrobium silvestre TaxID=1645614 RepID=A0A7Y9LT56_9MICC|nr:NAD(P)/FAD-dependent oxidoreductase [Psychromicrobium silvestre]NYE95138.1 putative flavoprotein involved in K+ transport [Psychromicrobium silvestre]